MMFRDTTITMHLKLGFESVLKTKSNRESTMEKMDKIEEFKHVGKHR